MRSGRLARVARLGGMAAGLAGDAAGALAGAAAGVVGQTTDAAAARFHRDAAERLARVLGEMKGLPQKVGQILSVLDDAIPAEHRQVYREVLGRLQAQSEPLSWEEVLPVVQAELGQPWQEVFARVEPRAVAAASIGQVHRATLLDGREVAVKVQYPGIQAALESDLANVGALVGALSAALPRTSVEHLVQDVAARFREELDYRHEATVQAAAAARWDGDPGLRIPALVPALCTDRVLVSEWLAGRSFDEALDAPATRRGAWGAMLWRFTWHSVLAHGWIHGDPHPGNLRFQDDGALGLLDFGCSADLPPTLVAGLAEVARRAVAGAPEGALIEVLAPALGLPGALHPEVARAWDRFAAALMRPVTAPQPFQFDRDTTTALVQQAQETKLLMARHALWHGMPAPTTSGTVLLMRTAIGQAAVLSRLQARADFRAATGL